MRRVDGRSKVTGQLTYAVDLALPDMLFVAAARSAYPHARIVSVDTSTAARAPGVRAVLCGRDIPGVRTGRGMRDVPVLAVDKVRFIGEMVAVVAAESRELARRAAEQIHVEYEPLTPVFDPIDALEPDAPVIHSAPWTYERAARDEHDLPNVISRFHRQIGDDIEVALKRSDRVFEHAFRTPKVHQGYLEPFCCIAQYNADATVRVWSSNKSPYALRAQLAATFDLPVENIIVETAGTGGDFGAKGGPLELPVCVELSRRTGRPVRFLRSYTEELTAGTPSPGSVSTIRVGVMQDGCIQAFQMRTLLNAGAYGGYAASSLARMVGGTPYRLPAADVEVVRVYTNEVPNGSMRAPGAMQIIFATEAMMEFVAHELGLDPFELRRRNLLQTGETSVMGNRWPEHRGIEVLDLAENACHPLPAAEGSVRVGRGVAVYDRPTHAPMRTSLRLRRQGDGTIEAMTPIQETGTGSHTVAQRVIAHELGVAPERVVVRHASTEELPFDFGVGGQLVTSTLTNACARAARALLDSRGDEVTIETGEGSLHEGGVITYCVQVADVAVDVETGQMRVLDFVSAHDVAEIIEPVSHRGQIDGGFAMGLGFALSEDLSICDGRVTASHLGDYKLPSQLDMPPLRIVLLEGGRGVGPLNIKGIGEMANAAVAPAIANAVSDALGVCMDSPPLTSENVFNLRTALTRRCTAPSPTGRGLG